MDYQLENVGPSFSSSTVDGVLQKSLETNNKVITICSPEDNQLEILVLLSYERFIHERNYLFCSHGFNVVLTKKEQNPRGIVR